MRRLFAVIATLCLTGLYPATVAQELDITEIVTAQAAYDESQTDARRAALLQALENYQGDPAVETVNAHLIVLRQDAIAGDFEKIRESARAASAHLEPVKDIVPRQYIDASLLAAVALFNSERDGDAMIEMAHVQGFARQQRDSDGNRPDWADKFRWQADAWNMAMDAFFETERIRHPEKQEIDAVLATYKSENESMDAIAVDATTENGLPFCPGRVVQSPKLKYPVPAAEDGLVGAVILGLDFDAEGKVVNPKVLASIPSESFDDTILKTASKWRYRANKRKDIGVNCGLERTNVVLPFIFTLE